MRVPRAHTDTAETAGMAHAQAPSDPLLEVRDLETHFSSDGGVVKAVDGVNLAVRRGEVLGLVGESGCGKSATALSIMRLVDRPGRVVGGSITLDGIDLLTLPESKMVRIRGNRIAMIFQQPQSSLDPVFRVGDHVVEAIRAHRAMAKPAAWQQTVELLRLVGIPDAERRAMAYPHELSGGMAQRVMIAIALACAPDLLIADEPTTALDVTIQEQILDLLRGLRSKLGMAILLITHDLGVIAEMADRVAVMYAGRIVEETDVRTLFFEPMHPYTRGLIGSMPSLDDVKERLEIIPGTVPDVFKDRKSVV
jgi:ABC-type dipeptide/oligopeptide/nickel transport system ATPase component